MSVSCIKVREALRIISEDDKVKGILVNVFGGIVDCATIANGVVHAYRALNLKLPACTILIELELKILNCQKGSI